MSDYVHDWAGIEEDYLEDDTDYGIRDEGGYEDFEEDTDYYSYDWSQDDFDDDFSDITSGFWDEDTEEWDWVADPYQYTEEGEEEEKEGQAWWEKLMGNKDLMSLLAAAGLGALKGFKSEPAPRSGGGGGGSADPVPSALASQEMGAVQRKG